MYTTLTGDVEVEEIQRNELTYINNSPLTKPTLNRPIYIRESESTVKIYPTTITSAVTFDYIKKPIKPSWGYIVAETKAMYEPNYSTDFELHASDENELIYKILKFAGLNIRRDDLAKGGQGLESLQVQQEKQ